MPNLILVDDGTLDTVIECTDCHKQERFGPDYLNNHEDRVETAIEAMGYDHYCSTGPELTVTMTLDEMAAIWLACSCCTDNYSAHNAGKQKMYEVLKAAGHFAWQEDDNA